MNLRARIFGRFQRDCARWLVRRPFDIRLERAVVSFTFDDFPVSALTVAGAMLEEFSLAGTYYVSLGLLGQEAATGPICHAEHLPELMRRGHELGCHTFGHCHSWNTPASQFERAILENRDALSNILAGADFGSFSYPIHCPHPRNKARAARYFPCSRGGGQRPNAGTTDLNYLSAFFLEQSRDSFAAVVAAITENVRRGGWLIFATHDVCAQATRFGCGTQFFRQVVMAARDSGALILPVARAWDTIQHARR